MSLPTFQQILLDKNKWLLRHTMFWVATTAFLVTLDFNSARSGWDALETTAIFLPLNMLFAYVILYVLIPHFLIREKYAQFVLLYLLWSLIALILNFVVRYAVLVPIRSGRNITFENFPDKGVYRQVFALGSFALMNTIAMFGVPIKLFKYWYIKQRDALQLQKEKLESELSLLKAQIHPHFLFNTLNNLYAFAIEKSDKTPAMLLQLAGLLSYVLYECEGRLVPLENEIQLIRNYIDLEKERYERLDISLNFSGDILDKMVAPLLFLPFVENAFKHGASEQLEKPWISVDLSVKKDTLIFKMINSLDPGYVPSNGHGLGMRNITKRLDLLYSDKHELAFGPHEDYYLVSLTLQTT